MKEIKALSLAVAFLVLPLAASAAPIITLSGGNVTFQQGGSYQEPGYSAFDAVDGDLTSFVNVVNGVVSNVAGNYGVSYSVTNSSSQTASESRSVTVTGLGGMSDPCNTNGTCPCPINGNPITGDHVAWKSCVMQKYPKLLDGSTLVCRLQALFPGDNVIKCAKDQAGFGEMKITPNGTEIYLY